MPLAERQPAAREAATLIPVVERAPQCRRNRPGPSPDLHECARPRRAASPLGSRRTPGAGTFLQKRTARPRGRTGRADPGPPAPWRRHGPRPGTARPERRDRARGARAASASRASASACCWAMVGRSAIGSAKRGAAPSPRARWYSVSRAAASAFMSSAPDLRLQSPAKHHGTVVVLVDVQRPARVLSLGLPGLGLAIHAAPAAHDPLDVGGRTGAPHPEQPRFGLRSSDTGQGPDLGVRQLPTRESLGQERQRRRGRAPRGPSPGPRPGRVRSASSASGRRSGTRYPSRRGRRTRGSGRGGGRWRPRDAPTARRSRRRGGPVPQRVPGWVSGWWGCLASGFPWRASLVLRRLYTPVSEPPGSAQDGRFGDER